MDKNAFKPSKKQMYLIFRGVAFCAKRNIFYLCSKNQKRRIMKTYFLSLLAVLSVTLYISCDDVEDNAVPTDMTTEIPGGAYMYKPADLEKSNEASYSILNILGGGEGGGILNNPFYWWSIMSDDCYGSGGLSDNVPKSLHHFTMASAKQYETNYSLLVGGVTRTNITIELIDNVAWTEAEMHQRNQLLGEAFFLRGLYHMWFSQLFGDVPLYTSTIVTEEMQQQVSADEVLYPQIISDFVSAIHLMKPEKANGSGHADKFAAEAFLARAYMFWAGFYHHDEAKELATSAPDIPLVAQEGCLEEKLTKEDVVNYLKDIVDNGGYRLLRDFRSLWQYSNSYLWNEARDGKDHAYQYIADVDYSDCFDKPGMGNGNLEEIFQIQFRIGSVMTVYPNKISYYWGLRQGTSGNNGKRDKTYPFNQGLGQGTPSCNIWDDWTHAENTDGYTDLRKRASIIDLADKDEIESYTYEKDDCEESGYAVKKYANVNLDANAKDNDSWWIRTPGYSPISFDNMQYNSFEDFYLMRYADVLLMLTELTGDAQYMNRVQQRAGVPLTPYSLSNVQNERRWEFAFEGLRFNDMRRWSGINSGEYSYAAVALQRQEGQPITVMGEKETLTMHHMTCSWTERYAATNGFLPKPEAQISLMHGALKQNPGWDDSNPKTLYKALY